MGILAMEHTNRKYGQELLELTAKVIQMGDLVVYQLDCVFRSFNQHDFRAAAIIIDREH